MTGGQTCPPVTVECLWPVAATLGESPVWWADRQCLLFVDIKAPAILWWRTDGTSGRLAMPSEVGAVVLRESGGLFAALRSGLAFVDPDSGQIEMLASPERELPENRFNDGKCDPSGRFWIASMHDPAQKPSGNIWRVGSDLVPVRMDGGFVVGNGFGWNRAGTAMYFTDSEERTIFCYAYEPSSGTLGDRSVFARIPSDQGYPDGLCVDEEDHVWSAHWDGWRITRYRPDGSVERVVPMPVPRPTSVAFGGPDLGSLYVTSARDGLDEEQLRAAPLSGALFRLETATRGLTVARFAR